MPSHLADLKVAIIYSCLDTLACIIMTTLYTDNVRHAYMYKYMDTLLHNMRDVGLCIRLITVWD